MNSALMNTPLGPVAVHWQADVLTGVDLDPDPDVPAGGRVPGAVRAQIETYFRDAAAGFDLPLELGGTPFQRRVWAALQAIPPGRTRTYGELARELGTSPRAIGGACRANPCPIVVPCHRVVAADGLGGFAGDTSGRRLAVKRWLLRHEGALPGPEAPLVADRP